MKNLADFCVRYKLIMFSFYRARNVTVMCKVFKTRDQGEAKSTSSFWSYVKQTKLSIVLHANIYSFGFYEKRFALNFFSSSFLLKSLLWPL